MTKPTPDHASVMAPKKPLTGRQRPRAKAKAIGAPSQTTVTEYEIHKHRDDWVAAIHGPAGSKA